MEAKCVYIDKDKLSFKEMPFKAQDLVHIVIRNIHL